MKTVVRSSWSWSALHHPEIVSAGRYPVLEKSRGLLRRPVGHVALHHHGYAGALHIGGERFDLLPGDLTLTPVNTASLYDLPDRGFQLCIQFQHQEVEQKNGVHTLELPLHIRPGLDAGVLAQRMKTITDLIRRAEHAAPRRRAVARAAASAGLQELILSLSLMERDQQGVTLASSKVEAAVRKLVGLIEQRLGEPLSVPELAREAQLSQNYLARAFRARYGLTVPNYLLRRRIERARHLLTTSRLCIKQVAAEVGLADLQHFNKQFRRLSGVSPSAYRETHGQRAQVLS